MPRIAQALLLASASAIVGPLACGSFSAAPTPTHDGGPGVADGGEGDGNDAAASFSAPEVIASNEKRPHAIFLDAAAVYWQAEGELEAGTETVNGEIVRYDRGMKTRRVLAGAIDAGHALVMDETTLYWLQGHASEGGTVGLVHKDGSGGLSIFFNTYPHRSLAVDDAQLLYVADGLGAVHRIKSTGEELGMVRPNDTYTYALAADSDWLYVGTQGQILRAQKATNALTTLFASGVVSAMATSGARVYWATDDGQILSLDRGRPGEAPLVLAKAQNTPTAVAVAAGYVYWTNRGDGTVMRVSTAGGVVEPVASGQQEPVGIAADESAVFWTNAGNNTVVTSRIAH